MERTGPRPFAHPPDEGPTLVVALTPNPSLDLLFDAERLVWDDANRLSMPRHRAGGQGINVVRAVRTLGGRATAVAPLGGAAGDEVQALLAAEGTPLRAVRIAGETRVFVAVRERETGRSLLLNPRGPELADLERTALFDAMRDAIDVQQPRWAAGCGSLPPGVPPSFYADLGRVVRDAGARWAPDCDGESLRLAAEAGCDLLAPNEHEAERLLDRSIGDVDDAADAARALLDYGPRLAAVTLGERGAVAATADGAWHAATSAESTGSAVGAGDGFLAALLLALDRGDAAPDVLRCAVAAGTAVLRGTGSTLLDADAAEALTARVTTRRL